MKDFKAIGEQELEEAYEKIKTDAMENGYFLNPDIAFSKDLIRGLLINENRYGYPSCPCRLASGIKEKDLDIICPCDYRDDDLNDYDTCYCALYVSEEVFQGKRKLTSIPERRGKARSEPEGQSDKDKTQKLENTELSYPVYRCKVCGYLCARNNPPGICPICKAKKDRFERFL
jgi:ferredoxin-thioredoxin reductase catalytic subunit